MDSKIIDDFLDDFESFRSYCDEVNYDGITNPADGVFYDGVSVDIPEAVKAEVIEKVAKDMGRSVTVKALFLRLSTESMDAPHQAHTDSLMGRYSLMLYMNKLEDCEGGTSLVIHKKTGLCRTPVNEKQLKTWQEDTNNQDAWQISQIAEMIPNRAFIFDASLMHRAEPVGGFGDNGKNGRLVLTMFYD